MCVPKRITDLKAVILTYLVGKYCLNICMVCSNCCINFNTFMSQNYRSLTRTVVYIIIIDVIRHSYFWTLILLSIEKSSFDVTQSLNSWRFYKKRQNKINFTLLIIIELAFVEFRFQYTCVIFEETVQKCSQLCQSWFFGSLCAMHSVSIAFQYRFEFEWNLFAFVRNSIVSLLALQFDYRTWFFSGIFFVRILFRSICSCCWNRWYFINTQGYWKL